MKTLIFSSLLLLTVALTSCSTNKQSIAREQWFDGSSVVIFSKKPADAQLVGLISTNSYSGLTLSQANQNAMRKLKYKAKRMGANGIVVDNTNGVALMGATIDAEAIFVPGLNNSEIFVSDDGGSNLK
jgi:hypothetical protein